VKKKNQKIAAKKIKKSVREQVAALPKKQKKVTYSNPPEKIFCKQRLLLQQSDISQQSKSWDKALSNYSKAAELSPYKSEFKII
jgi:hypothetical protein